MGLGSVAFRVERLGFKVWGLGFSFIGFKALLLAPGLKRGVKMSALGSIEFRI